MRKNNQTRNFLIHGYDQINLEVVWKTIKEDIPLLRRRIKKFFPSES